VVRVGSKLDTVRLIGGDTPEIEEPRKPVEPLGTGGQELYG
jgi:hypothetical protein